MEGIFSAKNDIHGGKGKESDLEAEPPRINIFLAPLSNHSINVDPSLLAYDKGFVNLVNLGFRDCNRHNTHRRLSQRVKDLLQLNSLSQPINSSPVLYTTCRPSACFLGVPLLLFLPLVCLASHQTLQ